MEGQRHMPAAKVKAPRKPKIRDLDAEGFHPHAVRKSNQPEVANRDGYAAADLNQAYDYAQGYGYGDGTYGYGYSDGTQGWDADQGYGYDDGTQGCGHTPAYGNSDEYGNGAHEYEAPPAPKEKPKKPKKPKTPAAEGSYENQQPVQGGSYEYQPQVAEYGQPSQNGSGAPGYEAPPAPKEKPKKSKKPKTPAAEGSYDNKQLVQGGSYNNQPQVDEYGQPSQNGSGAPLYEAPPVPKEKPKKSKKPKTPAPEGSHENQQPVQGGSYEYQPQVDEYGHPLQNGSGAPGYEAPPAPKVTPKKSKKPKTPAPDGRYENQQPVQGGSYDYQPQVDEYGQPLQNGYGAPGYEALPAPKEKPKKSKKPKTPAGGGSYEHQQLVQGGSYNNQPRVDEYGQPLQDGYGAPASTKPHKSLESSKDKSLERASHSDGAYVDPSNGVYGGPGNGAHAAHGHGDVLNVDPSSRAYAAKYGNGAYVDPGYAAHRGDGVNYDNAMVPYNPNGRKKNKDATSSSVPDAVGSALSSRALSRVHGEHDNDLGSARSRSSQEGSQGAAPARARSSDREGSGSNRAKPHRENEIRSSREGSGVTPRLHPSSRRTVENESKFSVPAPNALNEHLRETSRPIQHDSLVVFTDLSDRTLVDAKSSDSARSALNEFMKQQEAQGHNVVQQESLIVQPDDNKDALETQLFGKKLQSITLPPVETAERPQFQAVADNPLYQPVKRRPSHPTTKHQEVAQVDQNLPIVVKKNYEPNAKCMACVHGVGVPITRVLTRIACKQCQRLTCMGCTIL